MWDTFPVDRVVLMACRTLTSTIRLLETHRLFRDDVRLRFLFAVDTGSRFSSVSARLLHLAGVPEVLDWTSVSDTRPDLTLTASENVDMSAINGNVLVLPHGLGFNKFVPTDDETGVRVAGVPDATALETGRLRLALTHPAQQTQLRALCPETLGRTIVTGDPTLDELTSSFPLRDHYRTLLHSTAQRVVLISSTWGAESAIGRWWTLPTELLAALPADDYRVCLALHPNVWARYGSLGVQNYLAKAMDSGVVLLPPETGWRAALVASDVVIADHGSLALHAAALGKPLLLTGNATEVVPGTPMAEMVATTPHLDPRAPLAAQIERAQAYPSALAITDQVFAHRGAAVGKLRHELYRALDLAPLEDTPLPRVVDPLTVYQAPRSFRSSVSTAGAVSTLVRYPAAANPGAPGHLVIDEDETDLRLHERAAVVCRGAVTGPEAAQRWAHTALTAHPGARLAVARLQDGCLLVARDGAERLATSDVPVDVLALGSLGYERLLAGGFGADDHLLCVGDKRATVRFSPARAR